MHEDLKKFAPHFVPDEYTESQQRRVAPFFTNLDKSVYASLIFAPELIGALCSRASRATGDLRAIFLKEFLNPFLEPVRSEKDTEETWEEKNRYGQELHWFIEFLQEHPLLDIFSNPRARSFYVTWLAQYGDDSIAQMAGMHIGFASLSQIALKHPEDQRIGLAPIEKSTRYVAFGQKVGGRYLYYTDPTLSELGLRERYESAMDGLFETYNRLIPKLTAWLMERFPEEKPSVVEKKAFDTMRGLLPMSTLSQVAFFGNGQAFEHFVNRSARHALGEIRWAGQRTKEELSKLAPSFFRRLDDPEKQQFVQEYQEYLAGKGKRMAPFVKDFLGEPSSLIGAAQSTRPTVRLLEYDPLGQEKVIAGMLYSAPNNHHSWNEILKKAQGLVMEEKDRIIGAYMKGRSERFQKAGRAFENAYVRFELVMNNGAWRDIQRHRMMTQHRQLFTCVHGYDVPPEVTEAGLEQEFKDAIRLVEDVFVKIHASNPELAQYATTMAHRIQTVVLKNLRQAFWLIELRSIPEGHPDYRHVAQEEFRHLEKVYPLITKHMRTNMGEYDFARRGQEERFQAKLANMTKI